MKKIVPILFAALLIIPSACIKDDLDACAGILRVYFSYIYGGTNEFYSTVNTNIHLGFYHRQSESENKYREVEINRTTIGIRSPWMFEKTFEDQDSVTLISWTHDDRLEYVTDEHSGPEQSYVRLKEITEGDGICSPVEDLFYGKVGFDAGLRIHSNDVTIPYTRAVCRMRVTMIPATVQKPIESVSERKSNFGYPANPDDFEFFISGTRDRINYDNLTFGKKIGLKPGTYYDENNGHITTKWFGAFSSLGEYLKVTVVRLKSDTITFDCSPKAGIPEGLTSVPGRFIDLEIDGSYMQPRMTVFVNGWRTGIVDIDM